MFVQEEKGFASIAGICWLGLLLLFGGAIYSINESETLVTERFLAGKQLQHAAESGLALGCRKLLDDTALQNTVLNSPREEKLVTLKFDDITCDVYVTHKGNKLLVMAVSTRPQLSDKYLKADVRLVACLSKQDDTSPYTVEYWEH